MIGFFSRVWDVAREEVRTLPKRPWEWITGLLLPVFWLIFVANSFGPGLMRHLPVGLVNIDGGRLSHELIMSLDALPSIEWIGFSDRERAEAALRNGQTYATLVIPEHYTRDNFNGLGGTVELQINKSYYAVGTTIESDVKQAFLHTKLHTGAVLKTMMLGGSIKANEDRLRATIPDGVLLGNPSFNFNPYLLATLIPGLIVLGCALTVTGVLVRNWREKNMNAWLTLAKGSPLAALLGRVLPWTLFYILIGWGWIAYFAGFMGFAPLGSLGLWALSMVLLVLSTVAYCTLFLSIAPSWVIAISLACMAFAPSFPFTGFSFPFSAMTPGASYFGQLLPLTHYLAIQGNIFALGTPASTVWAQCGHLALFVVIPFVVGALILTKRFYQWRDEASANPLPKEPTS